MKPKHLFTKTGIGCPFGYSSTGQMWDRDMKITKDNFGRKMKSTGYIYLTGSKYSEADDHLKLIPCLKILLLVPTQLLENT